MCARRPSTWPPAITAWRSSSTSPARTTCGQTRCRGSSRRAGLTPPPSPLRQLGVEHSKVAERNDSWWEAERVEEELLRRHRDADESTGRGAQPPNRPPRTPEPPRAAAKKKTRRQRDKARKERQRPAVRLVPGPARKRERSAEPSPGRSRSNLPRTRGRDASPSPGRSPAASSRGRRTSSNHGGRSPSVLFPRRHPVRRSSSPSHDGSRRGGNRYRYEGGHQRFGPRR